MSEPQALFSHIGRLFASGQSASFSKKIDYAVFDKKGHVRLFRDNLKRSVVETASLVVVFNPHRAKRPRSIQPERSIFLESRPSLNWRGPSGKTWSICANKFPILPQNVSNKKDMQPFNCIVVRSEKFVHQRKMFTYENLFDMVSLLVQLNKSVSLKKGLQFRLGINGWYYSSNRKETRTATLAQAHGQLIRFDFPIERARFKKEDEIGEVVISTLADSRHQWGTGFVLEARILRLNLLAKLASLLLEEVTKEGNSFSIFVAPTKEGAVRVFIVGRSEASPLPYFKSGWSFSEIARVPIVSYPDEFWTNNKSNLVRNDLLERTQKSLQRITLPQNTLKEIYKRVRGRQGPS